MSAFDATKTSDGRIIVEVASELVRCMTGFDASDHGNAEAFNDAVETCVGLDENDLVMVALELARREAAQVRA
jgi:hypothetical protein